ncbi:MAG: hypothetical protein VR65_23605 [Desulfobulbaceae bacterium BRH_c16a]|nr:MAG: hypothetical protein VR65_23605 [Desulfobulbaceae bacterium BRH_c16a]
MGVDLNINVLQQLWLQQLHREFDDICLSHGISLEPPIFEISGSVKVYGCWLPATRTLRLSRHLILHHSWAVTLQVLKHEMAHQLCSEWHRGHMTAHGEDFHRSCELLGVLPEFRRAGTILPEMVAAVAAPSKLSEQGRKCMARIEKLLALGRSANEHEASLAMEKANELIEKHHLHGLSAGLKPHYAYVIIDRKKKRIPGYQRHICSILQEFFFVRVVLSQLYDPVSSESYKTIELFGTPENTAIAEYCYHFLENRLALLWSQNGKKFSGRTQTEKNSYYLGLLRGFSLKLRAQKETRATSILRPETGALMLADEQRLAAFVGMRYPRLRRSPSRGVKIYGGTYNEGVEMGKTITFTDGIAASKKSTFGGLLPHG